MKNKKIESISNVPVIDIALDTIKMGKQAIIFVNTKNSAEKSAEDISKKIKNYQELSSLSEAALNALPTPTSQCERLAFCLKKGIAFHHSGLVSKQRELIEKNFREGLIKIICATPTLAAGVDLPAFRAIIKDLKRYGIHGLSWIPVLEYHQQSGRAGRPKFDDYGEAIAIASSEGEKSIILDKYIFGNPEDIYSKLAVEPVLRTYLLSLIAANYANSQAQIMAFFGKTFWAFQFRDLKKLQLQISKMLNLLEQWGFIIKKNNDFASAAEIEDEKIIPTFLGKRVAELYIDPLTAYSIIKCLNKASQKESNEFSLLQMISNTLEMRPLLRVSIKDEEKIQEQIIKFNEHLLNEEPSTYDFEYDEFLNSIKTAMMLMDWINEKDEEFLMKEYKIRPGELRLKMDISDWLLFTAEEICKILRHNQIIKEISKLRLRIQYGVCEELLPLLKLKQIGRVRARKLYSNRIKDIKDIKNADIMLLSQILGKQLAINIKNQVGQEIEIIPQKNRTGQMSLRKY